MNKSMPTMYKLLYLDDDPDRLTQPLISSVEDSGDGLKITPLKPKRFEEIVSEIEKCMNDHHGLILDWKLNGEPVSDGLTVAYKAAELAQYFRREAAEGKRSFPIFVWSTEQKLKESYYNDNSSHDLFDKIYLKESIDHPQFDISKNPGQIRRELISFAESYQLGKEIIPKQSGSDVIMSLLGLNSENTFNIDERILFHFETHPTPIPSHDFIQFIFRELIDEPGPLINESLLAARLGIDNNISSSPDWPQLLKLISQASIYNGIFSAEFQRWWMAGINSWWDELSNESLMFLTSFQRIKIISEKTGLKNIKPASPINENYSSSFWSICEGLKVPIDTEDGFIIKQPEPLPWQDRRYISKLAALERIGFSNGLRVHPLVKDDLQNLIDAANHE